MFRSYNDESINSHDYYDSEEEATAAFHSVLRCRWETVDQSGRWVAWRPSISRADWKGQRAAR